MLDSKKTLKERTREYILNLIRDQHLMPGDKLPAQREISRILNVSPKIPEIVLSELEAEHLVIRHSGRGTFLADQADEMMKEQDTPNRNIFLLLPNLRNLHFAGYAANAEIALVRYKKSLQLITGEAMPDIRDVTAKMILEGTSGIVAYYCPDGLREFAHKHNVPIVEYHDRIPTGRPPAKGKHIYMDLKAAGLLLGKHLLELGHRDIYLAGDFHQIGLDYRFEALAHFLQENGCKVRLLPQKHPVAHYASYEAIGAELAQQMLADGLSATAGIFFNTNRAVGAMRYLMQQGVKVPEDFSIAGFDKIPDNGFPEPVITSTTYEREIEIGINLLLSENKSIQRIILDPVLIPGSSTAKAKIK